MAEPAGLSWRLRATVAAVVRTGGGETEVARQLGDLCAEAAGADGVSMSVMIDTRRRETLYASDAVATTIENVQFTLGEGPCFETFQTGRPVLVPDLAATRADAWPVFASAISTEPVRAIFAFPIAVGVIRVGALDLYRRTPGPLEAEELAAVLHVADAAAVMLLDLQAAGSDGKTPPDWADGARLGRHPEVHQATGMLAVAHGITAGQAFTRLRAAAFAAGRLIDDLARDVAGRRIPPGDL
jgi:GAF domain/ANTAR domain